MGATQASSKPRPASDTQSRRPIGVAELNDLKFSQSADVMVITHPSHTPMQLNPLGRYQLDLITDPDCNHGAVSSVGRSRNNSITHRLNRPTKYQLPLCYHGDRPRRARESTLTPAAGYRHQHCGDSGHNNTPLGASCKCPILQRVQGGSKSGRRPRPSNLSIWLHRIELR
jgi:hypothetical protein